MVMEFDYNQILENVQLNNMVLAAAGDGVVSGLDVSERGAGVNMSVDVATGSVVIAGTTYTESSIVNLAISAADATHARKDLVVYDVATTNPLIVTGTPATPPTPPDITTGDILLAIVNVAANETEITNSEITDCIVEVTKLDELATPTDVTTLNASASVHGLLKKLSNSASEYLNGQGNWATPTGAGDMSKSVYDTGDNGIVDNAEKVDGKTVGNASGNVPLSNGSVCTNLLAAWSSGVAAADISGTLPVAHGGTGVSDDSYDADKVDGCDAGQTIGDVWQVPNKTTGYIFFSGTQIWSLAPGTDGYQLTTHSTGNAPTWAAASDLIFSDTHCPKCGAEFQDGDNLILHLIGHNEVGDIQTIPMHLSCANEPKKTVTIKRKVMEDRHTLDEETGELKVQRMVKTTQKTVARHKVKEGYVIDGVSGKAHTVDDKGIRGKTAHDFTEAVEEIETTIDEVVYEDVEYEL